jgi:hypothetical protein
MARGRWLLLIIVAVLLVGRFVAYPTLQGKMIRDQCAHDGGTLVNDGTKCVLPSSFWPQPTPGTS